MKKSQEMKVFNEQEDNQTPIFGRRFNKFPFFVKTHAEQMRTLLDISIPTHYELPLVSKSKIDELIKKFTIEATTQLKRFKYLASVRIFALAPESNANSQAKVVEETLVSRCVNAIAIEIDNYFQTYHPLIDESAISIFPEHLKKLPTELVELVYSRVKEMNKGIISKDVEAFFENYLGTKEAQLASRKFGL